jgi:hypothetical protein
MTLSETRLGVLRNLMVLPRVFRLLMSNPQNRRRLDIDAEVALYDLSEFPAWKE